MTNELQEIISHYFPSENIVISPVPFGLTNTTCFVTVNDDRYVVRHYNRYTKSQESLRLELEVSSYLLASGLSFTIPAFLPTQAGEPFVIFADGTIGALMSYIPGTAPSLQDPNDAFALGRVVGELGAKLSPYKLSNTMQNAGIPFTDLFRLHPLADAEQIALFWRKPPFHITDEQKRFYDEALAHVTAKREVLLALPRQLVHHDILVYNLLSVNRRITAVLDFDFLAMDVSFLEFVISFNHVLQMSGGSIEMAAAFIKGYKAFRTFSAEEWGQLQALTRLYHVAVLHIYIGQHAAGKDISIPFSYIANQLIERVKWLNEHERNGIIEL